MTWIWVNDDRMLPSFILVNYAKWNNYYDSRIFDAVVCDRLHKLFCRLQLPSMLTNDYFPLFKCVTHEIWLGSSIPDPLGDHQREKSIKHDLEFLMCMHWGLSLELCLTYAHTPTHTFAVVYLFHSPPSQPSETWP